MSKNERMPLAVAMEEAKEITDQLWVAGLEEYKDYLVCGSIRRSRPTCRDIDLALTTEGYEKVKDVLPLWLKDPTFTKSGKNKGRLQGGYVGKMKLELYVGPASGFGALTLFATGSPGLNIYCRQIANRNGWKLSQYGLFEQSDNVMVCDCTSELPILKKLGIEERHPISMREM